jgi:ATP-binding cassette subfamily F protein uup
LNNVVTSTLVFEGDQVREYAGGYDDWLRQRPSAAKAGLAAVAAAARGTSTGTSSGKPRTSFDDRSPASRDRRLTYKEQQELSALPEAIARLEADIADLHQALAEPEFYKRPGEEIARETARLRQLDEQLVEAYHRWEALESRDS